MKEDLYGWLELVEASPLSNTAGVERVLKSLVNMDYMEVNWVKWHGSIPKEFMILCWGQPPPNFADLLYEMTPLLTNAEYLTFELKIRFGISSNSLYMVRVTKNGVYAVDSGVMDVALNEQVREAEIDDAKQQPEPPV